MATCEDAPCCGCCGTNLMGSSEAALVLDAESFWCDLCGCYHVGDCPPDWDDEEDEEDARARDEAEGGVDDSFPMSMEYDEDGWLDGSYEES